MARQRPTKAGLLEGLNEIQQNMVAEVRRLKAMLGDEPSALYLKAMDGAHKALLSSLTGNAYDEADEQNPFEGLTLEQKLAKVEQIKQTILGEAMASSDVPAGNA